MRQQTRLWDSYPAKSPNLRHRQAHSQNKELSRASRLWTGPSPAGHRQARAARARRELSWPQRGIIYQLQAGFIANQDFLIFWMVDIYQEGHSQRSASQKRYTAHLRRCASCTSRKPSGRGRRGDKLQQPCLPSTWYLSCLDLGRHKTQAKTSLHLSGAPEYLNLSGLDLESAYNPGPASDSSWQSNLEPKQCRQGKHKRCELGQTQCGRDTAST